MSTISDNITWKECKLIAKKNFDKFYKMSKNELEEWYVLALFPESLKVQLLPFLENNNANNIPQEFYESNIDKSQSFNFKTKLFGITLLRRKIYQHTRKLFLFNFIPLWKRVYKDNMHKYYLFQCISVYYEVK